MNGDARNWLFNFGMFHSKFLEIFTLLAETVKAGIKIRVWKIDDDNVLCGLMILYLL